MTVKNDSSHLPATLAKQVDDFIASLSAFNHKRPRPRLETDYDYVRHFFKRFLEDQNTRAAEIASSEYQKVREFALSQFPTKTMLNLCIDGRVLPILVYGASAIISSSVRVPGGMLRDFIRGTDAKLKLRQDSYYAQLLHSAFERYDLPVITQVYDSHLGCAARLGEEQAKGRSPQDTGLYADVSHKKQIAQAVTAFCDGRYGGDRRVIPVQTSFDPHSGYLYMGLERDEAMIYAKAHAGFTEEVLKTLSDQKKIISTERLVEITDMKEVFDECFFPLDWKNDYVVSFDMFWHGIAAMRYRLFPVIQPILLAVYPHLAKQDDQSTLEREERLFLLLANAFSGYILNHTSKAEAMRDFPHNHTSHYPYTTHEEEGVDVSEGVYPPNNISMFAVFNLDEKNLLPNIDLSSLLVRKNRAEGRILDSDKLFTSIQEFTETSVPVVVQEVVRDNLLDKEWQTLAQIMWDDLPENWNEVSDVEFISYLHAKQNMPSGVAIAINNLRRRMAILYDPESLMAGHFVEHYKVALPVITGRYRMNYFVVPFVKLGFNGE